MFLVHLYPQHWLFQLISQGNVRFLYLKLLKLPVTPVLLCVYFSGGGRGGLQEAVLPLHQARHFRRFHRVHVQEGPRGHPFRPLGEAQA